MCQNALPVINQERTAAAQLLCQILDKLYSCLIMSGQTKPTRGPRRKLFHIRAEVLDNVCLVRPQYQLIQCYADNDSLLASKTRPLLAKSSAGAGCGLLHTAAAASDAVATAATAGATATAVAAHAAAA